MPAGLEITDFVIMNSWKGFESIFYVVVWGKWGLKNLQYTGMSILCLQQFKFVYNYSQFSEKINNININN